MDDQESSASDLVTAAEELAKETPRERHGAALFTCPDLKAMQEFKLELSWLSRELAQELVRRGQDSALVGAITYWRFYGRSPALLWVKDIDAIGLMGLRKYVPENNRQ